VGILDVLLITLMTIVIVLGLQAVGVVLMSALLIAPAAAARQWTDRLSVMVCLSAVFGAMAGVVGSLISSLGRGLSTGPVIVLCASVIVVFSLLFAPNRGMIWNWLQQRRNRKTLRAEAVLADLFSLASQHDEMSHPHSVGVLQAMNFERASVTNSLQELSRRGLVRAVDAEHWSLTPSGVSEARRQKMMGGQE
jgi:manganese/zinc/iron transport system permease protein